MFRRVSPRAFWTTLWTASSSHGGAFPSIRTGQQMTLFTAYAASRRTHERFQASLRLRGAAARYQWVDNSQGVLLENGVAARWRGTTAREEIRRESDSYRRVTCLRWNVCMCGREMNITRDFFSFSGSFLLRGISVSRWKYGWLCFDGCLERDVFVVLYLCGFFVIFVLQLLVFTVLTRE